MISATEVMASICKDISLVTVQCIAVPAGAELKAGEEGKIELEQCEDAKISMRKEMNGLRVLMQFGQFDSYIRMAGAFEKISRIEPMEGTEVGCVITLTTMDDDFEDEDIYYLSGYYDTVSCRDERRTIETFFLDGQWGVFKINSDEEEEQ